MRTVINKFCINTDENASKMKLIWSMFSKKISCNEKSQDIEDLNERHWAPEQFYSKGIISDTRQGTSPTRCTQIHRYTDT